MVYYEKYISHFTRRTSLWCDYRKKVKYSGKNVYGPIAHTAEAHFRSSYTTKEADLQKKYLAFSPLTLLPGLLFKCGVKYKHFYLVQQSLWLQGQGQNKQCQGPSSLSLSRAVCYQPSSSSLSFMVMPCSPPPSETEAVASSTVKRLCRVS